MELLKILYSKKINNKYRTFGLFLCPYCLQEVTKEIFQGKRDKSCGCQKNKLISEFHKGKPKSENHKKKIKENHADFKGMNHPMYGKKHTKESKRKNSESNKISQEGENNSNWQGGKSFEIYPQEFKRIRESILEQDNYTCQNPECDIEIKNYKGLTVHHIDFNKKNNNPENLITLCKNCHAKTFGKNNRYYWIDYYSKIVEVYL